MSMTKKDYELVAESIKSVLVDCESQEELEVIHQVGESLAVDFQDINLKFDRNKFLTACGIEQEQTK